MPYLKIVTAPDPDADVLFDFNHPGDENTSRRLVLREGFSFGSPRRQGDSDAVNPTYDGRELAWQQRVYGIKVEVLAALSAMARRLSRGPAWLQFQLAEGTEPYWFQTRWHDLGDLSFENVAARSSQDVWTIPISLPVEPYAVGALVTHEPQVVVCDPTAAGAGVNPARLVLPPVTGDAPTPLRVAVAVDWSYPVILGETHTADTVHPPIQIPVGTESGVTSGTDTAGGVSSTDGIGGTVRVCNFAGNATLVSRLYGDTPPMAPGRYRVRIRVFCYATTIRFQFTATHPATPSRNKLVTEVFDVSGDWRWVDLGVHALPAGLPGDIADHGSAIAIPWSIRAARLDGAQTVTFDHIELIPVEVADTIAAQSWQVDVERSVSLDDQVVIDGDTGSAWLRDADTGALLTVAAQPVLRGFYPYAYPGAENVLHLLHRAAADDSTMTVTTSYRPRYALIGDS